MAKTVNDNEYELRKKGNFFRNKQDQQGYKDSEGNKYYWLKSETYGEYLNRIINCL